LPDLLIFQDVEGAVLDVVVLQYLDYLLAEPFKYQYNDCKTLLLVKNLTVKSI